MQEAAAARQQPEVVEGVACVHPVGCGAYKPSFPTLIVHPVEIDSNSFSFFYFFCAQRPGTRCTYWEGKCDSYCCSSIYNNLYCGSRGNRGKYGCRVACASTSECKQLIIGKWMFGGRECGSSSLEESSKPVFISDLDALY